jgi:RimJ/RimL family protein N-acetyltransferase
MKNNYIFQSDRLGFRTWQDSDLAGLSAINSNPEVMRFFPGISSTEDTWGFIQRMQMQYADNGFCYYAVELLETGKLIGFTGIAKQEYEADFTPCIDIGWRLDPAFWGQGIATEAALRCIEYAFQTLGLNELLSVAPILNKPSISIMEKIGMTKVNEFLHTGLKDSPKLEKCVLYSLKNNLPIE